MSKVPVDFGEGVRLKRRSVSWGQLERCRQSYESGKMLDLGRQATVVCNRHVLLDLEVIDALLEEADL